MLSLRTFKYLTLCAAVAVAGFSLSPAHAQDSSAPQDLMPPQATVSVDATFSPSEETHPPLRLTPDKSEILEVNRNVNRVIIGNDVHMNILMDSSRRMVVIPRMPGATYFTLLDENGKIIMQRYAIVANPKEKYLRIREPCTGTGDCMPIRMFYCPGMCHEIAIVGEDGQNFSGSAAAEGDNNPPQQLPEGAPPPQQPPSGAQ
ncbi:MAG: pilus assembly protein N-terminal domain-containing protein [Rhodospirillales bacterium]|nr:pilus assembly protein N-terminal domain-containing protein [Rhodospirillales bacterium]MCB9994994.1 pilus assembly protein N-terminal domain-containing protein [Rhodospirillales bacterium]